MVASLLIGPGVALAAKAGVGAVAAVTALREASKYLLAAKADGSLVGYTQVGRVEPLVLIDEACRNSPMLPDVAQIAQAQFTGYLLRAFSLHNISISNVSVAQRLEPFSTHRSASTALALSMRPGMESFEDRLFVEGDTRELPEDVLEIAQESMSEAEKIYEREKARLQAQYDHQTRLQSAADARSATAQAAKDFKEAEAKKLRDAADAATALDLKKERELSDARKKDTDFEVGAAKVIDMAEASNLAVGKMVNVTITANGNSVNVPLAVKLNCFFMASMPLLHILASGSQDISFSARWKKWWHGGIDLWKDLVMCQDLIDAHSKNLKADKTGIYLQMMQRRSGNSKAAMVSGMPSANSASNIVILSSDSAAALELRIGGKLKDFKTRQRIFQEGYGMLMFVIDDKWGRVRIYTRDIPEFTEVSERDIKASAKGTGPDIGDILSAFRAGSSPRLYCPPASKKSTHSSWCITLSPTKNENHQLREVFAASGRQSRHAGRFAFLSRPAH